MTITISGTTGLAGVDGSASTPAVQGGDSNTGIFFPAADTVAIATGGTEAMRVNSSQNVGIGTSSPATRLHVLDALSGGQLIVANSETNSTEKYGTFATQHYTNAEEPALAVAMQSSSTENNVLIGGALGEFNAATAVRFYTAANNTTTTGTERARITSGGTMLLGRTADVSATTRLGLDATASIAGFVSETGPTTSVTHGRFINGNGTVGSISTNGTATTYSTSSDYRLKEQIQPMVGALAKVAELKPVTYKWKTDGKAGEGFVAHELQAVMPDAVVGEKDAVDAEGNPVYQGIDTSFLVATLTAAIQEQQAMIEELKAKVAALEAA